MTSESTSLDSTADSGSGAAAGTTDAEALVARLLAVGLGAFDLLAVHLGGQLGWYRALARGGLLDAPGARAADVGCGAAWSSVALARTFPGLEVDTLDVDRPTAERAPAVVREAGVADRVRVGQVDAADLPRATCDAVFSAVEVLPVEGFGVWRSYRLLP